MLLHVHHRHQHHNDGTFMCIQLAPVYQMHNIRFANYHVKRTHTHLLPNNNSTIHTTYNTRLPHSFDVLHIKLTDQVIRTWLLAVGWLRVGFLLISIGIVRFLEHNN